MVCKRGEIWLAEFIGNDSSIQYGIRPCVVSSNDAANLHSPVIHAIPITSKTKSNIPVHVIIDIECGLLRKSIALIEQEAPISKASLIRRIGTCTKEVMKEIEKAILIQKGIIKPFINQTFINERLDAIKRIEEFIKECKHDNLSYDEELMEKAFLIKEIEIYCRQYNIKPDRFLTHINRNTGRRFCLRRA